MGRIPQVLVTSFVESGLEAGARFASDSILPLLIRRQRKVAYKRLTLGEEEGRKQQVPEDTVQKDPLKANAMGYAATGQGIK